MTAVVNTAGERLFARYAYAPNELGYCGPAETAALFDLAATGRTGADVHAIARRFFGAWPYAAVLAELAGIADPLDEQVMRAYWTGSPLLESVDGESFGAKLLDRIAGQAGHYWAHLTADLLPEAAPTHAFHVFGVYPWTRLLPAEPTDLDHPALHVLDSCRIRWGQVVAADGEQVRVRCRRLTWDGHALALGAAAEESARLAIGGRGLLTEPPLPGQWLALHWGWVCEQLDEPTVAELRRRTSWQLDVTNRRLARSN